MRKLFLALAVTLLSIPTFSQAQVSTRVRVTITNVAPRNGVAITPPWVGFHNGNFDSYNGGLTSLEALERVAEDGDNSLLSAQFNNFNRRRGGYTFIFNSGDTATSRLVRTGDLTDRFRRDATVGAAPLLPGQSASRTLRLRRDGSNDFFSYVAMVLPTNDFFIANGSPVAHDISRLLRRGRGRTSFFIGTPDGGVNDAGTEREDFRFSAGNGLFSRRNLPSGQSGPNQGRSVSLPIENVVGFPFADFRRITPQNLRRFRELQDIVEDLVSSFDNSPASELALAEAELDLAEFRRRITIRLGGFNFNRYADGIAEVTITAIR